MQQADHAMSAGAVEERLERAQSLVASHLPEDSYYRTHYRPAERDYWWPQVPAWLEALPARARVLDVGCAYGTLAVYARLRGLQVSTMDALDTYQPHTLFRKLGIDFRCADVEREPIPFATKFEAVVLTEVIEHWNFAPVPTLQKIAAVLRPGGALLLSTPDAKSAWGRVTTYVPSFDALPPPPSAGTPAGTRIDTHIWQYTRTELEVALREGGLIPEQVGHTQREQFLHLCVLARRPPGGLRNIFGRVSDVLGWRRQVWRGLAGRAMADRHSK
jgi:SAM-dependent methyltransferase